MGKNFNILSNIVKPEYTEAAGSELTTKEKVVHNAHQMIMINMRVQHQLHLVMGSKRAFTIEWQNVTVVIVGCCF